MSTVRQLSDRHSERARAGRALLAGLLLGLSLTACGADLGDPLQAIDAPSVSAAAGDAENSSVSEGPSGSAGSAVEQQPDPQPEQPKPQEPKQPKPTEPEPTEPTRQGAPYDIEPFDNIGGPLNSFRDAVDSRCSGEGSACLQIVENNDGDDSDPTLCIVQTISYSPAPGPEDAPEEERKLQRGATVTVDSDCNPPDEGGSDG